MVSRQTASRVLTGIVMGFVLGVVVHQAQQVRRNEKFVSAVGFSSWSDCNALPICGVANLCGPAMCGMSIPCCNGPGGMGVTICPMCSSSSMSSLGCDPAQSCAANPCPTGEICTDTSPAGPPLCHTCTPGSSSATSCAGMITCNGVCCPLDNTCGGANGTICTPPSSSSATSCAGMVTCNGVCCPIDNTCGGANGTICTPPSSSSDSSSSSSQCCDMTGSTPTCQ